MRAWLFIFAIALVSCRGRISDEAPDSLNRPPSSQVPSKQSPSTVPGSGGPVAGPSQPIAGAGAVALQVAVGGFHACALIVDGTVSCWGSNLYHEIGNSAAQEANPLPVKVTGLRDVTSVAAGGYHTCALASDHTVSCWGWNQHGQLGDGTTSDSETPVRVVGLSDVVEISAGSLHTCARLLDQTVRCWGLNHQGQLGDGRSMVEAQTSPVLVSGLAGAISISAGDLPGLAKVKQLSYGGLLNACALQQDGRVFCWGRNDGGEVGDGTTAERHAPSPVAL